MNLEFVTLLETIPESPVCSGVLCPNVEDIGNGAWEPLAAWFIGRDWARYIAYLHSIKVDSVERAIVLSMRQCILAGIAANDAFFTGLYTAGPTHNVIDLSPGHSMGDEYVRTHIRYPDMARADWDVVYAVAVAEGNLADAADLPKRVLHHSDVALAAAGGHDALGEVYATYSAILTKYLIVYAGRCVIRDGHLGGRGTPRLVHFYEEFPEVAAHNLDYEMLKDFERLFAVAITAFDHTALMNVAARYDGHMTKMTLAPVKVLCKIDPWDAMLALAVQKIRIYMVTVPHLYPHMLTCFDALHDLEFSFNLATEDVLTLLLCGASGDGPIKLVTHEFYARKHALFMFAVYEAYDLMYTDEGSKGSAIGYPDFPPHSMEDTLFSAALAVVIRCTVYSDSPSNLLEAFAKLNAGFGP